MCIVHVVFVCAQDISVQSGENVTFQCNSQQSGATYIFWYSGTIVNDDYVAISIDGEHTDYDQWKDRTDIDASSGDLTVYDLDVIDDGRYSCRYDDWNLPPQNDGSSYVLDVTGTRN